MLDYVKQIVTLIFVLGKIAWGSKPPTYSRAGTSVRVDDSVLLAEEKKHVIQLQ